MDKIEIKINGEEQTIYTDDYIEEQVNRAFMNGLYKGAQIQFHAMEPCHREQVDEYLKLFWNKIDEKLKECRLESHDRYVQYLKFKEENFGFQC